MVDTSGICSNVYLFVFTLVFFVRFILNRTSLQIRVSIFLEHPVFYRWKLAMLYRSGWLGNTKFKILRKLKVLEIIKIDKRKNNFFFLN